jgi:hypothetical protein
MKSEIKNIFIKTTQIASANLNAQERFSLSSPDFINVIKLPGQK